MNIVYITDEGYVLPTVISITSLVYNTKRELDIYVICADVSEQSKEELKSTKNEKCNIIIIDADKWIDFIRKESFDLKSTLYTDATLLKFYLAEVLENIEKVLFIDGDTLVMRDLNKLYDMDIDDYYLAAADDGCDSFGENEKSKMAKAAGIKSDRYFNSGVMLLNLKKCREEQVFKKLLDRKKVDNSLYADQDAMNYCLGQRRLTIDMRYNFLYLVIERKSMDEINYILKGKYSIVNDVVEDIFILHFAGKGKPWKYDMPYITSYYLEYYKKSIYSEVELHLESYLFLLHTEYEKLGDLYKQLYYKTEIFRIPKRLVKKIFKI